MRLARTLSISLIVLCASLLTTLVVAATVLKIPSTDLPAFARLLLTAGGAVGLVALLLMQPVVLGRLGGIRSQLVGASIVTSLLLLAMLMAFANAMFLSTHDFAVLVTIVLFAALLAIGFNLLWAGPIADRIERVRTGTVRMASGDLDAAVPVEGHDELAELAHAFNEMAAALKRAAAHERELEAARRELIAAVSHDLRTPLSAVRALIEAVLDGVAADAQTEARYLRSVQHEVEHLSQLVDDLFELAQIDAGLLQLSLERASLHDLISDTLASFQPQAARQQVRLIGEVDGAIDLVLMNPPKLQRALHNLISNALRHTPPAGTICLRAVPRGSQVEVEVADTGEGIAPDDLPHVFERAFRSERSRSRGDKGAPRAGLGLTITRGLIEAQGGTISVASELGKGTRFCFTLQRAV